MEPELEKIRGTDVQLLTRDVDALDASKRAGLLDALARALGEDGRVRVLLRSIAFGSLEFLTPERPPATPAPAQSSSTPV